MRYFLKDIGIIGHAIVQDCKRFENYNGLKSIVKRFIMYPQFRILCLYRLLNVTGWGGYLLFRYRRLCYKYQIEIPVSVKIGEGLSIPHGGPIVVNQNAVIGKQCSLYPCTLIGGVRGKGVPIIGDNVFIEHGAKVLGNIHIADFTFICPNTVVVKDTEEGVTVTGIPARILDRDGLEHVKRQTGTLK